jgi:hypothetical protein
MFFFHVFNQIFKSQIFIICYFIITQLRFLYPKLKISFLLIFEIYHPSTIKLLHFFFLSMTNESSFLFDLNYLKNKISHFHNKFMHALH